MKKTVMFCFLVVFLIALLSGCDSSRGSGYYADKDRDIFVKVEVIDMYGKSFTYELAGVLHLEGYVTLSDSIYLGEIIDIDSIMEPELYYRESTAQSFFFLCYDLLRERGYTDDYLIEEEIERRLNRPIPWEFLGF